MCVATWQAAIACKHSSDALLRFVYLGNIYFVQGLPVQTLTRKLVGREDAPRSTRTSLDKHAATSSADQNFHLVPLLEANSVSELVHATLATSVPSRRRFGAPAAQKWADAALSCCRDRSRLMPAGRITALHFGSPARSSSSWTASEWPLRWREWCTLPSFDP